MHSLLLRILHLLLGKNIGHYDPSELGSLPFVLVPFTSFFLGKKNKWSFVNCQSSSAGEGTAARGDPERPKPHPLVLLQCLLLSAAAPGAAGGHKP